MQIHDLNKNLLHPDIEKKTIKFINNIYSNSSFKTTNLPTHIPTSSKILTDDMF